MNLHSVAIAGDRAYAISDPLSHVQKDHSVTSGGFLQFISSMDNLCLRRNPPSNPTKDILTA